MLKKSLKTCISCDDPIVREGFKLNVCERCLQEREGPGSDKEGIAFRVAGSDPSRADSRIDS